MEEGNTEEKAEQKTFADEAMTFDEIGTKAYEEVKLAEQYAQTRSSKRIESWDRYYGRTLGNEVKGMSQFITREMMDTIEWMMPYFIRTFVAGDPKIEIKIKGAEPWVGKALMEKILEDLGDASPNHFLLFYQWFKDALVSDTSFLKVNWDLDYKKANVEFGDISAENMQQLMDSSDIKVTAAEIIEGGEQQPGFDFNQAVNNVAFSGVEADVKQIVKDEIYIENTPSWEFLVSERSKEINDCHGKGHKTQVRLDYLKRVNRSHEENGEEGEYFRELDSLISAGAGENLVDGEKANYFGEDYTSSIYLGGKEEGAKAEIDLIEWYTQFDVDGDGFLEDIVCFFANGKLIRWEENEGGVIPFVAIKPIIDCFKFFGISYADLLVEIQNLKTMLFRRILDNFDFQNSGRWLIDPNATVDRNALLNNVPGGLITGKIEGVKDISPQPFNPVSLSILQYVDELKENRTGITKYNQGGDSKSLNSTATGIIQIQNAAMQRLELIGRIFAEVGVKDFYKKVGLQYQENLKTPFVSKVNGQDREVTPEMIQGDIKTTVNMGIAASVGAEEAGKIEHMLGVLFNVNTSYPGLLTPEKIHNISKRYITSLGFKQADDFISDLPTYLQHGEQAQQQQQQMMEMQQQMQQMQQQKDQAELKIKDDANKIDMASEQLKAETVLKKTAMELDQRAKETKVDQKMDMMKFLIDKSEGGSVNG